jgi:hypothetical protein
MKQKGAPKIMTQPLIVKQLWIVVLPDGRKYNAGSSYHLTDADRLQMVGDVASRLSTDMEGEREEPIGDPVQMTCSPNFYEKIKSTPHGLRLR